MNQEMFDKLSVFDQEHIQAILKLFKRRNKKLVAALNLYPHFIEQQKEDRLMGLSPGKFLEVLFKAQCIGLISNDGYGYYALAKRK